MCYILFTLSLSFAIQFLLIFRYARNGTLEIEGLKKIAATCDVSEEGVKGAKDFFEAKVKEVCIVLFQGAPDKSNLGALYFCLTHKSHDTP